MSKENSSPELKFSRLLSLEEATYEKRKEKKALKQRKWLRDGVKESLQCLSIDIGKGLANKLKNLSNDELKKILEKTPNNWDKTTFGADLTCDNSTTVDTWSPGAVIALQIALVKLKYTNKNFIIDGVWGSQTSLALKKFQEHEELSIQDGKMNQETKNYLITTLSTATKSNPKTPPPVDPTPANIPPVPPAQKEQLNENQNSTLNTYLKILENENFGFE
jgi:hypothetical protein